MNKTNDNFIMLPTDDFCFKELMNNPKVRKGFIAAVLKIRPEEIKETCLLPTELGRHMEDDKQGILDVHVLMQDGTQIDMEMQILELQKLPKDVKNGEDIMQWMKFFSGKNREEIEDMAKTNEYLDEAYRTLIELSADDKKRLEYEAREKALRDYNSQMENAEKRGEERGIKLGVEKTKKVFQHHMKGKTKEEIAQQCNITVQEVTEILE